MPPPRQQKPQYEYASAKQRAEEHKSGFERTAYRVPDGKNIFTVTKPGIKRLDIAPYVVGAGNPYCDAGKLHYERTFFTHPRIGPNENAYSCPAKTAGKRCAVCEWREKEGRSDNADAALIKSLYPKERQLFNVMDLDEPDRGWQLWEISYHNFGKLLDTRIKTKEKFETFYYLQGGFTLEVTFSEESMGANKFMEATAIDFEPRDDYDESVLDEVCCLDDLPIILPYEDLRRIFLQLPDEEETAAAAPPKTQPPANRGRTAAPKATPKPQPEPEPPADDNAGWEEEPAEDELPFEDEVPADDDLPWDDEPAAEEEPEPAPPPARGGTRRGPKPAPEPEPEEDAGWDDEAGEAEPEPAAPPPKRQQRPAAAPAKGATPGRTAAPKGTAPARTQQPPPRKGARR